MFAFLAPAALKLFFGDVLKSVSGLFGKLFTWLGTLNIWQIGCIVLGIFAGIQHIALIGERRHSAKIEAHDKATAAECARFRADVAAKTALAQAEDAAHKAEVERDQNKISQESDNEIRQRIAAAVAGVRARMQPAPTAHPGGGGSPAVPGAPGPSSRPPGPSQEAVVPAADLMTCTTNTVLAEGWQSWWKNVSAVPR